jgi:hypothetical protein
LGIEQTFETLKNEILKEKVLSSIPTDVAIYIKECSERGLDKLADWAQNFIDAHKDDRYSGASKPWFYKEQSSQDNQFRGPVKPAVPMVSDKAGV